jgi:hypothetical protein
VPKRKGESQQAAWPDAIIPSSTLGANADSLILRPTIAPAIPPARNTKYQTAKKYIAALPFSERCAELMWIRLICALME